MPVTVGIHPDRFRAGDLSAPGHRPCAIVRAHEGDGDVTLFLNTPAQCDELIKAAVKAKSLLLGEDEPPMLVDRRTGLPLPLIVPDLAAAEADPANPYGSERCDADWGSATPSQRCVLVGGHSGPHSDEGGHQWPAMTMGEVRTALSAKHGEFGAPSAAAVAQDVELPPHATAVALPGCGAMHPDPSQGYICTAVCDHGGPVHVAYGAASEVCATWPVAPTGHLPQHTGCTYDGCTEHGTAVTR